MFVAIVIPGFLFSFNLPELISAGGRRVYLGSLSPEDYLIERLMEVEANGVYLIRVPSVSDVPEPPAVQRNARIDPRSRTNSDSPWTAK